MTGKTDSQLQTLGITLPQAAAPAANYVPFVISGNLLVISGQLPMDAGKLAVTGRLGAGVTLEQGQQAAKLCAINILAQAKAALGDLDRVTRIVRLGGFVASAQDFTDQPQVINGASNLMVEVFGDLGRHARAAVGVNVLPLGAAVEVDAIIEFA
ncbi:MAG: enamine deaminase RidA (YjgF/YER057c/UK114 family) [Alphaproteobacteria bacterium]|jgi:enamine deaminase RidA (YjgF/YER057c/UK114 family)